MNFAHQPSDTFDKLYTAMRSTNPATVSLNSFNTPCAMHCRAFVCVSAAVSQWVANLMCFEHSWTNNEFELYAEYLYSPQFLNARAMFFFLPFPGIGVISMGASQTAQAHLRKNIISSGKLYYARRNQSLISHGHGLLQPPLQPSTAGSFFFFAGAPWNNLLKNNYHVVQSRTSLAQFPALAQTWN